MNGTGKTTVSVQWRCPRMREHMARSLALEKPCPDCYSLVVTSVRVPYLPEQQHREVVAGTGAEASAQRWRVVDNVTGIPVSREFDTESSANAICREFNTPASSGGRHYVEVYIGDGDGWRRTA